MLVPAIWTSAGGAMVMAVLVVGMFRRTRWWLVRWLAKGSDTPEVVDLDGLWSWLYRVLKNIPIQMHIKDTMQHHLLRMGCLLALPMCLFRMRAFARFCHPPAQPLSGSIR